MKNCRMSSSAFTRTASGARSRYLGGQLMDGNDVVGAVGMSRSPRQGRRLLPGGTDKVADQLEVS